MSGVQAVERAFAVLRAIAAEDGRAGVSAVARHARLPKSTVARLLGTLEDVGAVERLEGGGDYRIGSGLRALAGDGHAGLRLVDLARPYLRELVAELDEDAGLAIPDGDGVLFVDQCQSSHPVQVQDWTGERFPMHTTAAGFVLLAEWPADAVDRYLEGELAAFTPRTLVDGAAIRARLDAVRAQGYAWTEGEWAADINGVGAVVRGADGRPVGAINLYGPGYRFPGAADPAALGRLVTDAAARVAAQLSG